MPHPSHTEFYICITSAREGDQILFTHEGGVDIGDVDAKALRLDIPVLSSFPSREVVASTLLKHVTDAGKRETLVDFITRLYAVYVDLHFAYLEINPLKVYERMIEQIEEDTGSLPANLPKGVTAEQAAENPQVQAIIEPRLTMLTEIANGFLTTIIDGLEEAPYGIRWICKQIRSLTRVSCIFAYNFSLLNSRRGNTRMLQTTPSVP